MEFKKQRPSIDPLMAFTLGEIEIPALAQERMVELRESSSGSEPKAVHGGSSGLLEPAKMMRAAKKRGAGRYEGGGA